MTFLVAAGHRVQDILEDYTVDEVYAYHRAALRSLKRGLGSQANVARAAAHASRAGYRRFIQALTKDPKEHVGKMSTSKFLRFFDPKLKGKPDGARGDS